MPGKRAPVLERIVRSTEFTDSCWLWRGGLRYDGYAQISVSPGKIRRVHRVAYELLRGPIPAGLVLDHLCRVPACWNPDHLEPVTDRVNLLRGTGWSARNASRTHCPTGHEYTEQNTYVWRGRRRCRPCNVAAHKRWRTKKREAA